MEALIAAPCWLVIGFNARPVVESLRRYLREATDPIATVDYFADVESRLCSDYLYSVLKQKPGEPIERLFHRKPGDYLTELAEILADEIPIGTILLGSGLDDSPDLWRRIASLGTLSGNDPDQLTVLRNREILFRYAKQIGLAVPKCHYFTNFSEFEKNLSYHTFPCVVRREGGGGGFNIFRCSNEPQAIQAAQLLLNQFGNGIIESYEEGTPASVSLLGTSKEIIALSFNEQIVGSKTSFCPSEFAYCGNIAPLQMPNDTLKILTEQFTKLGEKMRMIGTNGVDFILRNSEACVLELNPRFQG
ncbi:MAG: ATP-grasp domain-containing protein, partial [Candidatus Hodarchaeota archaeon]